jgi:hypothetical protein
MGMASGSHSKYRPFPAVIGKRAKGPSIDRDGPNSL